MKYYIIAGEPSGDLHGSNLMKAIVKEDKNAEFKFWGGDHMLNVDENIITHIRETSIMGFVEVARNISKIKSFFKKAKATIVDFQPDILILIDYPGFNLRMAKWAKKKGIKVAYYISPQLWAWKKGRIKTVKKYVDEMIVILPFEEDFYKKNGVNVHFVGHPLIPVIEDFINNYSTKEIKESDKPILAILPGSRKQEIKKMLPELARAGLNYKDEYRLCIAIAPNIDKSFYIDLISGLGDNFEFFEKGTYHLLAQSYLAIVTSGTATLETALFSVPQVVCYKTSVINYEIGRRLVDLKYISLVNLISGKEIVPELIQSDVNSEEITRTLNDVRKNVDRVKADYKNLYKLLSIKESPSRKAAKIIVDTILN